jgi:uncharacterized protein YceH (UPF0502 family)
VLLLRGPQTPGELKGRSERMATLHSLDDVERVLAALAQRGYVRRLERRPGQKEDRFQHLLGDAGAGAGASQPSFSEPLAAQPPAAQPPSAPAPSASPGVGHTGAPDLEARVHALESEVASLRAELARMRDSASDRTQVGSASPTA